jgi:hypothetical protein
MCSLPRLLRDRCGRGRRGESTKLWEEVVVVREMRREAREAQVIRGWIRMRTTMMSRVRIEGALLKFSTLRAVYAGRSSVTHPDSFHFSPLPLTSWGILTF